MEDFLNFRKMVSPVIIKGLFWLQVIGFILFGISQMSNGGTGVILGILIMLIGPFIARIISETMILAFMINETLTDIRTELRRRA